MLESVLRRLRRALRCSLLHVGPRSPPQPRLGTSKAPELPLPEVSSSAPNTLLLSMLMGVFLASPPGISMSRAERLQ